MAALLDDGHSVGYFSSQESIRFAREIQRSYRDLNARIAERIVESCQESELQRQAKAARCVLGCYYWPPAGSLMTDQHEGPTTTEGRSFTAAMSESCARLNARRAASQDAAYEAHLVRLSAPEYQMLEPGELICAGDEVLEYKSWRTVSISIGCKVCPTSIGVYRRRLTSAPK